MQLHLFAMNRGLMHEPIHPRKVLPHGECFLFVDEVLSIDTRRIVASRAIPLQEPWTNAHFPGDPLVPGVLLIEGMTQTCGILARSLGPKDGSAVGVLAAVDRARFFRPVKPGTTIVYSAELDVRAGSLFRFDAAVHVGEDMVAKAKISLSLGQHKPTVGEV
ncbi:MAG: beta-hydroxyacyl-ACP dehydratase [Polyangiaceae bacterium]|nr:beta-hydroxyacyl-ACP dehydratase [Polyangiaceae bacterium]